MKENVIIRKAMPGDEQILAYIQTESWKAAFADILSPEEFERCTNLERARQMYHNVLRREGCNMAIEFIENQPHCIAAWGKNRCNLRESVAELICIHSLRDNWSKGYGSAMMAYVLDQLRRDGYESVILWVFEANSRARQFYEKHGFILTEQQKLVSGIVERMYRKDFEMKLEIIEKTEAFLKDTFAASSYLQAHPTERDYRLEHSYRVANIAKTIAEAEGFDVTHAVIAGLLHDIAYCEEMTSREDRMNHGRRSAAIARPFLESLGLSADAVNEICYGIAIHVDDEADFAWERTAFCETVGDADNIDRFDVYRIYESLQWMQFSGMPLAEKQSRVDSIIEKLTRYKEMKLGTETAKKLWMERLDYQLGFYTKLKAQLENSTAIR